MSLFDVIRYPISDKPTPSELCALPKDLFEQWISQTEWGHFGNHDTAWAIGTCYQNQSKIHLNDWKEIRLLKEMIEDYEPL